jgi:hypothetical protein
VSVAVKRKHFVELIPGESEIPLFGALGEALQEGGEETGKAVHKSESELEHKALNAVKKPAEEALSTTETFVLKVMLNSVLLLAGLFLIVYGVMVAVRPRESAMSIPVPHVAPIPV